MRSDSRAIVRRLVASVLAAFASVSCQEPVPAPEQPRLVLLYATCSLNKDYLYPYNSQALYTESLRAFADGATVFPRHFTEAGQSGIAYASIFSSTQAPRHGVYRHPASLSDDLFLITEAFAEAGYETFYWNGHPMADPELNYAQGVPPENIVKGRLLGHSPLLVKILERMQANPDYKAFLLTNTHTTHGPYKYRLKGYRRYHQGQFREFTEQEIEHYSQLYYDNYFPLVGNFEETVAKLDLSPAEVAKLVQVVELHYKANVDQLDRLFGGVIDRLQEAGVRERSLIAFTSDHGELLYREGAPLVLGHSMILEPEVLNVPLIVSAPYAGPTVDVFDGVTRSVDVFPTLMGLAGLTVPEDRGLEGVDLSAAILGRESPPDLTAFSHTTVIVRGLAHAFENLEQLDVWGAAQRLFPSDDVGLIWASAVRDDTMYQWVRDPAAADPDGSWHLRVLDLGKHPAESEIAFRSDDPEHRRMLASLKEYKALLVAKYPGEDGERAISEDETMKKLRALGYVQ